MDKIKEFKRILANEGSISLRIKVVCDAGRDDILGVLDDGTIKVALKASPEKGLANSRLLKFLAKDFSVYNDSVKIITGSKQRTKLVKITCSK